MHNTYYIISLVQFQEDTTLICVVLYAAIDKLKFLITISLGNYQILSDPILSSASNINFVFLFYLELHK
jgi:hypothetical protein